MRSYSLFPRPDITVMVEWSFKKSCSYLFMNLSRSLAMYVQLVGVKNNVKKPKKLSG